MMLATELITPLPVSHPSAPTHKKYNGILKMRDRNHFALTRRKNPERTVHLTLYDEDMMFLLPYLLPGVIPITGTDIHDDFSSFRKSSRYSSSELKLPPREGYLLSIQLQAEL